MGVGYSGVEGAGEAQKRAEMSRVARQSDNSTGALSDPVMVSCGANLATRSDLYQLSHRLVPPLAPAASAGTARGGTPTATGAG